MKVLHSRHITPIYQPLPSLLQAFNALTAIAATACCPCCTLVGNVAGLLQAPVIAEPVDQAVVEAHPGEVSNTYPEDFSISNNNFDSGETSDDISNSEGVLSILPEVTFENTDLLPPASNPIIDVTYSVGVPVVNASVVVHNPPLIHSAVVVHDVPEVYCPRGIRHDPPMPLTSPSADLGKHRWQKLLKAKGAQGQVL